MVKTLMKDEKGTLSRQREHIMEEIESAWANLQVTMEQMRRRHYHRLGELFIQLRMTFDKGKSGDNAFVAYCRDHGPKIEKGSRQEYMEYRKKLGPVTSRTAERDLPPLRRVTAPRDHAADTNRPRDQYRRIVDEEIDEPEQFEIPRTKREIENELVIDLAEKIISAGFRVLSVKMHPDKDGGSNEAQKRLSAAKKMLEEALVRESLRR
jgi:hypothetical protein